MKNPTVLLVALAVIIIGVMVLFPVQAGSRRSKVAQTRIALRHFSSACAAYEAHFGAPPASFAQLMGQNRSNVVLVTMNPWPPVDAWGHPIHFEPNNESNGFGRVLSFGRDGRPGGQGLDADIEERFGHRKGLGK